MRLHTQAACGPEVVDSLVEQCIFALLFELSPAIQYHQQRVFETLTLMAMLTTLLYIMGLTCSLG